LETKAEGIENAWKSYGSIAGKQARRAALYTNQQ